MCLTPISCPVLFCRTYIDIAKPLTQRLLALYRVLREHGRAFEVVWVSLDTEQVRVHVPADPSGLSNRQLTSFVVRAPALTLAIPAPPFLRYAERVRHAASCDAVAGAAVWRHQRSRAHKNL